MFESNICFSMRQQNLNNYYAAKHFHECYELVYYIRGTGVSTIDGVPFTYSDHSFCIIPPNTLHSEQTHTETDLMYIGFEYDNSLGQLPITMVDDSKSLSIFHSMNSILQEMSDREANYTLMLTLFLNIIIVETLRITRIKLTEETESPLHMSYAKNYIKDNYNKNFKPEELAESIGYSYHYFRHLFKKQYGITLKQYIIDLRIKHAKNLLQETSQSIEQIANDCGFSSTARFITMFKQNVGETPLAYRKNYKNYAVNIVYTE